MSGESLEGYVTRELKIWANKIYDMVEEEYGEFMTEREMGKIVCDVMEAALNRKFPDGNWAVTLQFKWE